MKNNKNRIVSYILVLILLVCASGSAFSAQEDQQKHFLWSVKAERNTVYLMGSIHVMKSSSYPLPEKISEIYNCCNTMVFETDMEGMENQETVSRMMLLGLYPQGEKLSEHISGRTYELLEKRLALNNMPVEGFERFRPWFAAMTITSLEILRLEFDPELGIDMYFFDKAKKDGKKLIFLETNEFQINLMAGLSERSQEMFLRETLKELDVIERLSTDMVKAWRTGDVRRMDSILKKSLSSQPELLERFLINRNVKWLSRIEGLMKQKGDVLVIVGAGHLVGKDSLIELLKMKGYKVRQL